MRRVLGALTAGLLLAGCAGQHDPGRQPEKSSVDVDTAVLRSVKAAAGVEPCRSTGDTAPVKDGLPELTLRCLGGGASVDLNGLRGPLVVNLFAQWCGPCRKELPYYQELHRKAKGKVGVIGVDYLDTQPEAALQLVKRSGVTYPLLADPAGSLRTGLKVRGLPGIVFVDAAGKVSDVEFRSVESYDELRTLVDERLGVHLPS